MQHMLVCIKKYCSSGQGEPRDSSWSPGEVARPQSKAESCCLQPRAGDLPAVRAGCPDSNAGTTYSRGICAPKPRRGCKLGSGALSQGPLWRGRGVRQRGAGFIKRRPATSARFPDKRSRRRASKQGNASCARQVETKIEEKLFTR